MCHHASPGSLVPGEQMSWQWHDMTRVCHFLGQDTTQGWTPCAAGRCVRWDTAQGTRWGRSHSEQCVLQVSVCREPGPHARLGASGGQATVEQDALQGRTPHRAGRCPGPQRAAQTPLLPPASCGWSCSRRPPTWGLPPPAVPNAMSTGWVIFPGRGGLD